MQKQLQDGLGQGAEHSVIKKNAMVDNKTVAWATIGKTVLVASSQSLLDRAVDSYKAKTTVADAQLATRRRKSSMVRRNLVIFNLGRIADGVSNTMNPSNMGGQGPRT